MNVTNGFPSAYGGDTDVPTGLQTQATSFGQLPTGEIYAFHPGGANVVLADGSVRLIAVGTDISVVAALVTRPGGEGTTQSVYLP